MPGALEGSDVANAEDLMRETIKRIIPYSPGKSSAEVMAELGIDKVTKLASNENPLGPSSLAVAAMREIAENVFVYPDPQCVDLTNALAERLDVAPEKIVVGRGSDEVLHMLGLGFVNEEENLIFPGPPFAMYPITARLMGAEERMIEHCDFRHDIEAMADAIDTKTKLVFVCNPYNPFGTIVTADEVDAFMDRVPDTCIVVFDEAYFEYVDDPAYPDTLEYVRENRRCVVLRTFSKAWGLAGLRIGYGVMPEDIATVVKQVREPFNVGIMAQAAAVASLMDAEQVPRSVANNRVGKDYLYAQFEEMDLEYVPTQANFMMVNVGMDSRACFDALMRQGVTVRTGDIFGMETWIRVTIGLPEENQRFIEALRVVLDRQ
jgi:histidinol-phosphate aminotransferase